MIETEIEIDNVILNPDYAVIKRRGNITIQPGKNKIKIINLDPTLDEDSIKLMVSGNQLIVHNIQFSQVEIEDDEKLVDLLTKVDELEDEQDILQQKLEDEKFWLDYFQKIREYFSEFFAKGYATGKVTIADYTEFSSYMDTKIAEHEKSRDEIIVTQKRLKEEKKELTETITSMKEEKANLEKGQVQLTIDNASTQQTPLFELEYIISDSSWTMYYELNHNQNSVKLNKWVTVTNNSTEPWNDVILTLTDKMRSDLSIDTPDLAFINPEEGIESDFLIPVQSMNIEARVNIENNNKAHRFEIGTEKINEVEYTYYWNAHNFEPVIETLIISMTQDYLYPAPINIFLDGIFVDTIDHIDFTPPNEQVAIPLRELETFKVYKKALDKHVSESGILNKQVEMNYQYRLTVENPFEKRSVPLYVHERIPKPHVIGSDHGRSNLNVNVDYTKVSSVPHKVYESGLVRWELELDPSEKKEIDFNILIVRGENI